MSARGSAYRTYLHRIVGATAGYVGAIFAAASVLHHAAPVSPLAIGIALIPGLAVLAMIYAMARLLIDLDDEYLRMLEVRKALTATAVALAVSSVWGLLEIFTAVPKLEVFWIFPIWCAGLGVGAVVNRITHGTAGLM